MNDLEELHKQLGSLHMKLIAEIVRRMDDKSATSADLALAWKILTDNGVPLANLRGDLAGQAQEAKGFLESLPFPGRVKVG